MPRRSRWERTKGPREALGLALKGNMGLAQGDIRRIVVRSFAAAAVGRGLIDGQWIQRLCSGGAGGMRALRGKQEGVFTASKSCGWNTGCFHTTPPEKRPRCCF